MGNLCLQFVSEPAAPVPPDVQIRGDVNSFEMEEINGQSSTVAENTRGANAESPALEDDTSGSATVWKLTKRQEDDCEEIFSVFEDDEGMVDIVQHLGPMMRALSCKPTEEELTNITNRFQNMNQNNQMTFQQFLQLMAPHIVKANEVYAEDKIEAAFRRFDIDGNGFISASELRIALKENFCKGMKGVAEAVTDEDVEEIMQEADLNGDGKINYMEFKEMIPNLSTAIHMPTKVK